MNNRGDNIYLQICRKQIEKKLNWPAAEEWRNYEFNELSERIFGVTGVQLSISTLKRVFGKVKYESLPSSVTLNALTQFLGYENWMHWQSAQVVGIDADAAPIAEFLSEKIGRKKWLLTAIAPGSIIIILIGFFAFSRKTAQPQKILADSIVFESKPLAEGLPNTVVFHVDLKGTRSDNVLIQQSWDSTKTIRLKQGQTEATGIYYLPGYFRAKLIVDGHIIKEHDLFIPSGKWMATVDHKPVPTYLSDEELTINDGINIRQPVLENLKKINTPTTLTYHLVQPFNQLHSDNFTLETELMQTWREGPAVCQTIKVIVLCSKGAFVIPLSIPGCVSDINLILNDRFFGGKSNDLSDFGTDPSSPSFVKLEVKHRLARIFLNGKLLREVKYASDAGEVVGFRFSFLGAGQVKSVLLSDKSGKAVYGREIASYP